jgi:hypothetical protein
MRVSREKTAGLSDQRVTESALLAAIRLPFWVGARLPRGEPGPARFSGVSLQYSGYKYHDHAR